MSPGLVLASGSARRKELLSQLGYRFTVQTADIDEKVFADEPAGRYVRRMSYEKALAVALRMGRQGELNAIILAADTVCVKGGRILQKPVDFGDFESMMRDMSDTEHQVLTSVCIVSPLVDSQDLMVHRHFTVQTQVAFKALTLAEIKAYWASGEPQDKAGGYGIQGLGAVFVDSIAGSYSNVVGLPLAEVAEALADCRLPVWDNEVNRTSE